MTITLDLQPEIEQGLLTQATARGLSLSDFVREIVVREAHVSPEGLPRRTAQELIDASLDWSRCPAVESIPGKVSGAWVFKDTRMPVAAVFENLEDGVSIDELTELYAGLTRQQITAVLDFAARSLDAPAHAG